MSCHKSEAFISKKVFVSGQESAINLEDYRKVGVLPRGGTQGQVIVKCSNRDYHVEWRDGLLNLEIENMLFVAENGNDTTGTRTRLDLPFLTIRAAMLAAQAGDTVHVYPGVYTHNTGVLLAPGVNLYLEPLAVVNVVNPTDSTISVVDINGIYGKGSLSFSSNTGVRTITPTTNTGNAIFTFEGEVLSFNNVHIQWEDLRNLTVNFSTIQSNTSFLLYSGVGREAVNFNVGNIILTGTNVEETCVISTLEGGVVKMTINNFTSTKSPLGSGVFNFDNNLADSSIIINIARLSINNSNLLQDAVPLIINNNCEAFKDITFNNVRMANPINRNGLNGPVNIEKGTIRVRGTIIANGAGLLPSWIALDKGKQEVIFELELEDLTTASFGGALGTDALLNITSLEGRQVIKGSIRTARNNANEAMIVYGQDISASSTNFTAVLDNFTLVGTAGVVPFSLRLIDAISTAVVPCKGVYTNLAVDAVTNGGVTTVLDTLTVDAVNVL